MEDDQATLPSNLLLIIERILAPSCYHEFIIGQSSPNARSVFIQYLQHNIMISYTNKVFPRNAPVSIICSSPIMTSGNHQSSAVMFVVIVTGHEPNRFIKRTN